MNDEPMEFELHGYVDGVLDEEAVIRVEEYLLENPSEATRVRAYLKEKRHIRDYAAGQMAPEPSLSINKLESELALRLRRPQFFRWPQAAVLALVFVVSGWLGTTIIPRLTGQPAFTDEIIVAHGLMSEDSSEAGSVAQERLDKLFSRIGEPARLPDLSTFGLQAIGAQLLASDEGPVLHVLYRGDGGQTMSYFLYHDSKSDEVPLHTLHPKGVTMVYWQHAYSRYAVAGPMSDEDMEAIALHLDSSLAPFSIKRGA